MSKNFFNSEISAELMKRLQQIKPDSKPVWGIMTAAQMLKHLQLENNLALGKYAGNDYSNFFREKAFKAVITGRMKLPNIFSKLRLVPAIPELDVIKSEVAVGDFNTEMKSLLMQFHDLLHSKTLGNLHPGIGKMTRNDWGHFYYWHTDYHLKQFNV